MYDPISGSFIHHLHNNDDSNSINNNYILSIFEDSAGLLWIGTSGTGLSCYNKESKTFSNFPEAVNVFNIHAPASGNLWLGNEEGLIYFDKRKRHFETYTTKDGLPDNSISGILEDAKGNLWISTINGLSHFDLPAKKFYNYNVEDGLQSNHFNENAHLKSRNGTMYFGGPNGFNEFFPDNIKEDGYDPGLAMTGFQVFNKELQVAVDENDPSPLKQHISVTKEIKLPYSSSVISFEFASLNFTSPRKKQYAYMLEGFDKEWNFGKNNQATYTNLDPGRYKFKVRSTLSNGEWSSRVIEITLTVTPPFWFTWWFKTLFLLFILGSLGTFIATRVIAIRKRERELKRLVAERTRQLAHSMEEEKKARHLTDLANKELERKNIELEQFAYIASHDLQEPLRTTSGLVELLQQQYQGRLDEKADKYFTYIMQASDRMKLLIKNLLDFSRIGNKKVLEQVDCNTVLSDVLADLGMAINEAGAEISNNKLPVINGYPTELKQLFQNLVTNAIKFRKKDVSPVINISAKKLAGSWEFAFADNGIGIEEKFNERIFVIFQRLHTRTEYEGTGIGLSHCKKIVELHQGKIWLKSVLGQGSIFYFTLPNGEGTTTNGNRLN
jgi:signal transduction histidine kinase